MLPEKKKPTPNESNGIGKKRTPSGTLTAYSRKVSAPYRKRRSARKTPLSNAMRGLAGIQRVEPSAPDQSAGKRERTLAVPSVYSAETEVDVNATPPAIRQGPGTSVSADSAGGAFSG
ncbi:MAG: hypothetical protein AAB425_12860, partial [Bdellovibrionota bacterium]